jgi:hypothetical protein
MALPPSLLDAAQETVACAFPLTAAALVGAVGAVARVADTVAVAVPGTLLNALSCRSKVEPRERVALSALALAMTKGEATVPDARLRQVAPPSVEY